MTRKMLVDLAAIALVIAAVASPRALGRAAPAQGSRQVPIFQVDPTFFKMLPNDWVLGQGSAVAVDKHDNVWVLHRPRYVPADKKAAPPVLEFDATGKFIQAWGGPADGYDWPDQEHGIYVDDKDTVWISGSARPALAGPGDRVLRSDNMILKFTTKGKLVLQIGHRDQSEGNKDTKNVYSATDMHVYPKTNEVFVADGYINRRVIVFDADTGAFKRMWGAFGNVPEDPPDMLKNARTPARARGTAPPADGAAPAGRGRGNQPPALDTEGPGSPQFMGPVHSAKVSSDGLVYVVDRSARRVQVFTVNGKYVSQVFINRAGPSGSSACGLAFSADPAQRFLYVADYGNSHMVVLDRKTLEVLYQFGTRSATPGDFQGVHHMAVDSKGNLYTAEVEPGNRYQKFVFKGLSATLPPNALSTAQLALPPSVR